MVWTACKPVATPMEQNAKLRADVGEVLEDPTMYRKIVGSLIYATLTRPDMCHDVGVLSQFRYPESLIWMQLVEFYAMQRAR